jgi:hypothetical protein
MVQTFLPVADSLLLVRLRPREGLMISLIYLLVDLPNTFQMGAISSACTALGEISKLTVVSC